MKIKILTAMSVSSLEKKVNKFLQSSDIKVSNLQFSSTAFEYSVLVLYEEA